ncbi:MAG: hypothetical protein A2046_10605 [Bacteroidetes bacterium GWA2_30_7]|nr:MAG: hypothetical protein A2046_10605 [Bacteroidetes bacterium GWA2_30_7]
MNRIILKHIPVNKLLNVFKTPVLCNAVPTFRFFSIKANTEIIKKGKVNSICFQKNLPGGH